MKSKLHTHRISLIYLVLFSLLFSLITFVAYAKTYKTLEFGSTGTEVFDLQKRLNSLGIDPNGIDGKFGRGTENAVKQFQESQGLTSDGKAGTITLTKLYSISSGTTTTPSKPDTSGNSYPTSSNPNTLKYGDFGDKVIKLQTALQKLGYNPNGIDGKFGLGTQMAVIRFQQANNLTADGLAGTKTLEILYSQQDSNSSGSSNNNNSNDQTNTGSTAFVSTLRKGATGAVVKAVQDRLTTLGYYNLSLDGVYGTSSIAAVIQFQKNNRLTADGLVGILTYNKIMSSSAIPASNSNNNNNENNNSYYSLRPGANGETVRNLQKALNKLGYKLYADGDYGNATEDAVRNFQKQNNLTVDGIAGIKTQELLYSGNAKPANSSNNNENNSNNNSAYYSLRPGATGEVVRNLQKALDKLGYNLSADGSYGNSTEIAVKEFQKRNNLTADGIAGVKTQELLYSGNAKPADTSSSNGDNSSSNENNTDPGTVQGPSGSSVSLLHWFKEVRPSIRNGQIVTVFDPATNLQWELYLMSLGNHADSEPRTANDTSIMFKAFVYTNTWTPKPVYVKLPSGKWTMATMHNVPHLSGTIKDNNFDGHLCVHFLRDMDEVSANDPDYGVSNQKTLRAAWKKLTGVEVK